MIQRRSKYRNTPTFVDGIRFASKKEANRYKELKVLEGCGEINSLKLQPRFPLKVNGTLICTYVADFEYFEGKRLIIEDTKGVITDVFRIKAKLFNAIYPGLELTIL